MSETKRLTKAGVLRTHIDSAIILMAYEDAYVSAHTLVMACEELIRTLSDKKGTPYSSDWRTRVRAKAHTYINANYNFFKHADRDVDEMLEIAATGGRVLALRSVEFARNHFICGLTYSI